MPDKFRTIERLETRLLFAGGDLDTSFGTNGVVRDNVSSYTSPDNIRDIAIRALSNQGDRE